MSHPRLQRQLSIKVHEVLEQFIQNMDLNNPSQQLVLKICKILAKQPRFRNQLDLEHLEKFFSSKYKFVDQLKEMLNEEFYLRIFKEMRFECHDKHMVVFNAGDMGKRMSAYYCLCLSGRLRQSRIKWLRQVLKITYPIYFLSTEGRDHSKILTEFKDIVDQRYYMFRMVNVLKAGDYFGEVALQNQIPRTGTVITKTPVLLAALTYDTYQNLIKLTQDEIEKKKTSFLAKICLFNQWGRGALSIIMRNCEEISYSPFVYIYKKGDPIKYIYFIQNGDVELTMYQHPVQVEHSLQIIRRTPKNILSQVLLSTYQHFGDMELYLNNSIFSLKVNVEQEILSIKRQSDAQTTTHVKLTRLTLIQFMENYRIFSNYKNAQDIWNAQMHARKEVRQKSERILEQSKSSILISCKDYSRQQKPQALDTLKIFDPSQIKRGLDLQKVIELKRTKLHTPTFYLRRQKDFKVPNQKFRNSTTHNFKQHESGVSFYSISTMEKVPHNLLSNLIKQIYYQK